VFPNSLLNLRRSLVLQSLLTKLGHGIHSSYFLFCPCGFFPCECLLVSEFIFIVLLHVLRVPVVATGRLERFSFEPCVLLRNSSLGTILILEEIGRFVVWQVV